MKFLHQFILKIKLWISLFLRKRRLKYRLKDIQLNNSKFLVLNIPSHGNMGDQLIAYAIDRFLKESYPEKQIEFFTTGELECGVHYLKKIITPLDVIFITGGGFLGDIYPKEEKRFHEIMRLFSNNKIILFPQTFSYIKNSNLLKEAILLQKKCNNLIISTRERRSFDFIKSNFNKTTVLLLPDITTYLNFSIPSKERDGIVICSRNDKEKEESSMVLITEAIEYSKQKDITVSFFDTQVPYSVSCDMRNEEIMKMVDVFSSARLVITDRLHGMLYSIVTGTPVIAIDNSTKKISGAYNDWFNNLSYVRLATDKVSMNNYFEHLYIMGGQEYNNNVYIEKLKELIKYAES